MKSDGFRSSLLKVAEFAAFCGTTKDTLLWYDRAGLLSPSVTGENGYRYYTILQQKEFDMITVLKASGASLKEIRSFLADQHVSQLSAALTQKAAEIELQIQALTASMRLALHIAESLKLAETCTPGVPQLITVPAKQLFITPVSPGVSFLKNRDESEDQLLEHLSKSLRHNEVIRYPIGNIVDPAAFVAGKYQETAIFYEIAGPTELPVTDQPAGTYLQIFHRGAFSNVERTLDIARSYINENRLAVRGDIYEYDLVTFLAKENEDDMVFQFLIPVSEAQL